MFRCCCIIFALSVLTLADEGGEKVRRKRALVVDGSTFKHQCLKRHNLYRKWHGVKPLQSSKELDLVAQKYANKLAGDDNPTLVHSNGNYGENLYYYTGAVDGNRAVDKWYEEEKLYNYSMENPSNFHDVGHFTQMVWATSSQLGSGVATSRSGRTYVVCTYGPRGNYKDKFRQFVNRPYWRK